ncbi:hypothetical protein M3Y94_00488600 [Aphelenchoides besseyi]|nr:hypothetical protein M3Y94_00488600 [Aphelenchoides besseyi]KAI6217891.1 hypothetical protein M3Y95_01191200 [Aphelenchoides besseyi]
MPSGCKQDEEVQSPLVTKNESMMETQMCDGFCHKLCAMSDLRIYECGHVICGSCWTEMPTSILENSSVCRLGECGRKPTEVHSSHSVADYLADARTQIHGSNEKEAVSSCSCTTMSSDSSNGNH